MNWKPPTEKDEQPDEKQVCKKLASSILEVIKQVSEAASPNEIINLKKLSGYKSSFRIRIGVIIEKNTVTFVAFAHRKEIYNRFP